MYDGISSSSSNQIANFEFGRTSLVNNPDSAADDKACKIWESARNRDHAPCGWNVSIAPQSYCQRQLQTRAARPRRRGTGNDMHDGVVQNRRSAGRSTDRRTEYIAGLEQGVQTLNAQLTQQKERLDVLKVNHDSLAENHQLLHCWVSLETQQALQLIPSDFETLSAKRNRLLASRPLSSVSTTDAAPDQADMSSDWERFLVWEDAIFELYFEEATKGQTSKAAEEALQGGHCKRQDCKILGNSEAGSDARSTGAAHGVMGQGKTKDSTPATSAAPLKPSCVGNLVGAVDDAARCAAPRLAVSDALNEDVQLSAFPGLEGAAPNEPLDNMEVAKPAELADIAHRSP